MRLECARGLKFRGEGKGGNTLQVEKNYLHLQSFVVILRADLLFHEIVVVSIQSD